MVSLQMQLDTSRGSTIRKHESKFRRNLSRHTAPKSAEKIFNSLPTLCFAVNVKQPILPTCGSLFWFINCFGIGDKSSISQFVYSRRFEWAFKKFVAVTTLMIAPAEDVSGILVFPSEVFMSLQSRKALPIMKLTYLWTSPSDFHRSCKARLLLSASWFCSHHLESSYHRPSMASPTLKSSPGCEIKYERVEC